MIINNALVIKFMAFLKAQTVKVGAGTINRETQQAKELIKAYPHWKQIAQQFEKEAMQDAMSLLQIDMKTRGEDFETYPHRLLALMQAVLRETK